MISAKLTNEKRRAVYARDGYRCALCDNTRYLQIHHVVPRGEGGSNRPDNLITLCSVCHAHVHGVVPDNCSITPDELASMCLEYVADYYAPNWNPWAVGREPWAKHAWIAPWRHKNE